MHFLPIKRNFYPSWPLPPVYDAETTEPPKFPAWWEIENNPISKKQSLTGILTNIQLALSVYKITAQPDVTIVGPDTEIVRVKPEMEVLNVKHSVTTIGDGNADRQMDQLVIEYVNGNPPPGGLAMIIASDQDHMGSMVRLNRAGQIVLLLARSDGTTEEMTSQARVYWPWIPLIRGESYQGFYRENIEVIPIPPKKKIGGYRPPKKKTPHSR